MEKPGGAPGPSGENNRNNPIKKSLAGLAGLIALVVILASAFGAVFGFMSGEIAQKIFPNALKYTAAPGPEITRQRIVEEDSAVINAVEKAAPAVVSIVVSKDIPRMQNFFYNPFDFPDFFNPLGQPDADNQEGAQKQKIGGGSGFIITDDGMVVTNKHVVSDAAADYIAITSDGKEHPVKVLAMDPVNDFAVVKIEGGNYPKLSLGDSETLKIGQTVVAIGNSLGEFTNTVSKGIISGLRRNVTAGTGFGLTEQLHNIIQTDAAINPGNSGGPLLNIDGEVIGINVAMARGAQNIGFAIPSNQIKKTIDQVQKTGKISLPYLGVRYIPIDGSLQKENNLAFDYGALVLRGEKMTDLAVIPGSPADKAGIVENDIILEINGTKIDADNNLADIIARYNAGDSVILKIWHKGDTKDLRVKLDERK